MFVTPSGIIIEVIEAHFVNAYLPMLANWLSSAKVTVVSKKQPENAVS